MMDALQADGHVHADEPAKLLIAWRHVVLLLHVATPVPGFGDSANKKHSGRSGTSSYDGAESRRISAMERQIIQLDRIGRDTLLAYAVTACSAHLTIYLFSF